MKHMALDPKAPASMKYGPMLLGISYDGGKINSTSSACPFAATVLNTNYGGLDAAATIMYMNNLEVLARTGTQKSLDLPDIIYTRKLWLPSWA